MEKQGLMKAILTLSLLVFPFGIKADPVGKESAKWEPPSQQAQALSSKFLLSLKTQLMQKAQTEGPVAAFEFCSEKAQGLSAELQKDLPEGWSINRRSDKARNPLNVADPLDLKALKYFSDPKNANVPYLWLEESPLLSSRFYRPIRIEANCLVCHGEIAQMRKEVLEGLKSRYPSDKATGYKTGDLRGVLQLRVTRNP